MPVQIKGPDADIYGIYGAGYGASLAGKTGNAAADMINQMNLRLRAEAERRSYQDMLTAANAAALQGAEIEQKGQARVAYLTQAANLAKEDIAGAIAFDPTTADFTVNQDHLRQSDAYGLNQQHQDAQLKTAQRIEALSKAGMGYLPVDAAAQFGDPLDPEAAPTPMIKYINPGDVAAQTSANARMVSAQKGDGAGDGGGGGGVKIKYELPTFPGMPGRTTITAGSPAAIAAAAAASGGGGTVVPPRTSGFIRDPNTGQYRRKRPGE